jgi:hypothetical protein
MATSSLNIKKLILVPAIISLLITLVRLTGELSDGLPLLFNKEPGGAGALIGIAWLVPVFGIYFAVKLVKSGHGPKSVWKVIAFALLAIVVSVLIAVVAGRFGPGLVGQRIRGLLVLVAAIAIVYKPWRELSKTLLAYALAARIPVAVLMFFAILGNWGTHYDVPPPGFPEMGSFAKWVVIGLLPQLTTWIAFTLVIGSLVGGIASALVKAKSPLPD